MPRDEGFSPFLCGGIWWCHWCNRAIGQPSDTSRPVCPYCINCFVEVISYENHVVEDEEAVEAVARGIQSLDSFDSRPLNAYLSQAFVPDIGYPPLTTGRIRRWSSGECSRSPGLGQESMDNRYGRRGPTAASSASMDALEVIKVNGTYEATNCAICIDQINVGQDVKRLPCGHLYHGDCIIQWLAERNLCPLCRYEMPMGVPDSDQSHSGCGHGASASGRRLSPSQTWPFRPSMTMSEQAQGETTSLPGSNTESVSGFLYDAMANNFDVDYDGDVIMHDACG